MNRFTVGIVICTALIIAPWDAVAQEAQKTDVIIITAQKRLGRPSGGPDRESQLSPAKRSSDQHVTDVLDLNAAEPGLQVKTDDNAANPKIAFIRGIGLNDFNPEHRQRRRALLQDGVFIEKARLWRRWARFSISIGSKCCADRKERFMAATPRAGAVNLISRKPSDTWAERCLCRVRPLQ